jgi:hypothetical protein
MSIDLEKVFQFLNSLGGMPKVGLVFIFCVALSVALRRSPWVHNTSIPSFVVLAGTTLLPLLSDWPSSPLLSVRVFIMTQVAIGFITATLALLAHKLVLKPLLLKLGVKPNGLDSDPPFPLADKSNVKPKD